MTGLAASGEENSPLGKWEGDSRTGERGKKGVFHRSQKVPGITSSVEVQRSIRCGEKKEGWTAKKKGEVVA